MYINQCSQVWKNGFSALRCPFDFDFNEAKGNPWHTRKVLWPYGAEIARGDVEEARILWYWFRARLLRA
ncbi:hypothetical protein V6Z11_A09G023100 [Gossypium hirsutum]